MTTLGSVDGRGVFSAREHNIFAQPFFICYLSQTFGNTTKSWLIFILHIIENLLTRKIFQFTEIFQNFSAILSIKFIVHK